jgi:simple sugar transport system permease protein
MQVRAQLSSGTVIPYQFFLMLPYVMSILAMIVMARKAKYPQALLVPFRRGERV